MAQGFPDLSFQVRPHTFILGYAIPALPYSHHKILNRERACVLNAQIQKLRALKQYKFIN